MSNIFEEYSIEELNNLQDVLNETIKAKLKTKPKVTIWEVFEYPKVTKRFSTYDKAKDYLKERLDKDEVSHIQIDIEEYYEYDLPENIQ